MRIAAPHGREATPGSLRRQSLRCGEPHLAGLRESQMSWSAVSGSGNRLRLDLLGFEVGFTWICREPALFGLRGRDGLDGRKQTLLTRAIAIAKNCSPTSRFARAIPSRFPPCGRPRLFFFDGGTPKPILLKRAIRSGLGRHPNPPAFLSFARCRTALGPVSRSPSLESSAGPCRMSFYGRNFIGVPSQKPFQF
jgi:hypothetical protein